MPPRCEGGRWEALGAEGRLSRTRVATNPSLAGYGSGFKGDTHTCSTWADAITMC
jgi:hypothetical protein